MSQNTLLAARPASGGLGVFALRAIKPGQQILVFNGPLLDRAALDAALEGSDVDSYLQISADSYMGPSGGLDDFVNHSCDPNCGLEFFQSRIVLTAIRPITAEGEITFDYATTQKAYPCRFVCNCGSPICRRIIGDFDELPYTLKWKYQELGILAPYLSATLTAFARLSTVVPVRS